MLRLIILLLLTCLPSLTARDFAVADTADYKQFVAAGWELSGPRFSPDSSQVLFDKPGNIDFDAAERLTLDSLGVQLIPEDAVRGWLQSNDWNGEGE